MRDTVGLWADHFSSRIPQQEYQQNHNSALSSSKETKDQINLNKADIKM